jgi:hypothetical protein
MALVSPVERMVVRRSLPSVAVPELVTTLSAARALNRAARSGGPRTRSREYVAVRLL